MKLANNSKESVAIPINGVTILSEKRNRHGRQFIARSRSAARFRYSWRGLEAGLRAGGVSSARRHRVLISVSPGYGTRRLLSYNWSDKRPLGRVLWL